MKHRDQWPSTDPLGEALHSLRMSGTFYCRSELTAPWALTMPPFEDCLWFHVVMSGGCRLEVKGEPAVSVEPGDLVLVPHGDGHRIVGTRGAPAPRVDQLPHEDITPRYAILRHGGGGTLTSLVCGAIRFDHPVAQRLIALLPKVIHVEANRTPGADWIQPTIGLMTAEAGAQLPGGEAVITRLADILVVQAIRSWLQKAPQAQKGWLGALQDKQLGRAIASIHKDPSADFSIASLASEVAMSRSAFSARFTEVVGEPVMQYVTRWRMQLARTWLQEEQAQVGELASRLGYQSEAAFSRAFKRFVGQPPGAVRRAHAAH